MNCEQCRERLGDYVLGPLEADEWALVDAHLVTCDNCRRLAQDYRRVLEALPEVLAARSTLPVPEALRGKVLAAVTASADAPTTSAGASTIPSEARRASVSPSRRRSWGRLAAAVLVVLLLAWSTGATLALALERSARSELNRLLTKQEIVLEVVDSAKTTKVLMRSTQSGSRAYGKVYKRPDLPYVVAMAARLTPPAEGQVYALWGREAGAAQATQLGTMTVNADGFGLLVFQIEAAQLPYEELQVVLQAENAASAGQSVVRWMAG